MNYESPRLLTEATHSSFIHSTDPNHNLKTKVPGKFTQKEAEAKGNAASSSDSKGQDNNGPVVDNSSNKDASSAAQNAANNSSSSPSTAPETAAPTSTSVTAAPKSGKTSLFKKTPGGNKTSSSDAFDCKFKTSI